MTRRPPSRVGLAIVRAVVEEDAGPTIRILRLDDLFRDEQVIGITSSPDEAAAIIGEWLHSMVSGRRERPTAGDAGVTPS